MRYRRGLKNMTASKKKKKNTHKSQEIGTRIETRFDDPISGFLEFLRGGLSITDLEKYGWIEPVTARAGREKEKKESAGTITRGGPIVYRDRPRGWPTCARDGNRVVIGFIAIIVALVQIRGNVISPGPPGQTITFSLSPSAPPPPPVGKRGCTRIGDFSRADNGGGGRASTHHRAHKGFPPPIEYPA